MSKKLFFLFLIYNILNLQAQTLVIEKVYDFTTIPSHTSSIDTTTDGGYIVQFTQIDNTGIVAPGINTKLSANGDTIWTAQTGTKVSNFSRSACLNTGKSYLFASILAEYSTNTDTGLFVVNKYSSDKSLIYSKQYTMGDNRDFFVPTSILVNNPNDYWFFGWSANTAITIGQGGWWKFTIVRTDSLGNRTGEKVFYSGNIVSGGLSDNITKYGPGNYVMYGFNGSCCDSKPFLMKIRPNMDTIASNTTYWSTDHDLFDSQRGNLIYSRNNHFYVSGNYGNQVLNSNRSIVQKIDTSLNVIWTKKMGPPGTYTNRIFELTNDTILLVSPQNFTNKIWLFKITKDGNIADSTFVISTIGGLGDMYNAVLSWNGRLAIAGSAIKSDYNNTGTAYFAVIQLPLGSYPAGYNICPLYPPPPPATFTSRQLNDTLYLNTSNTSLSGYAWTFCNTTSSLQAPFCKISQADSISIKLVITNNIGCKDSISGKVWVNYTPSGINTCTGMYCQTTTGITSTGINTTTGIVTTTGINDKLLAGNPQIRIYPNPAQDELTIETDIAGIFYIYDLQSKLLFEIKTVPQLHKIDMQQISRGIYLYRFTTGAFTERGKIVKE